MYLRCLITRLGSTKSGGQRLFAFELRRGDTELIAKISAGMLAIISACKKWPPVVVPRHRPPSSSRSTGASKEPRLFSSPRTGAISGPRVSTSSSTRRRPRSSRSLAWRPMGLADINTLVKYRDQHPSPSVRAVFVLYNKPPFAIVARKSRGITEPKQLEGKKLGAAGRANSYGNRHVVCKTGTSRSLNSCCAGISCPRSVSEQVRLPGVRWRACWSPSCCRGREGDVRNWQDSSTVGVVGCFFVFLGLLLLAGRIAWQIMESAIPG
jgi:hypothetical protein